MLLLYTSKQLRIVFVVHLKATPLLLLPPLLHSLLLVPESSGGTNKQTKEQLEIFLFKNISSSNISISSKVCLTGRELRRMVGE